MNPPGSAGGHILCFGKLRFFYEAKGAFEVFGNVFPLLLIVFIGFRLIQMIPSW